MGGRERKGGFENACSVIAVLEKICKIFFLQVYNNNFASFYQTPIRSEGQGVRDIF